MGVVQKSKWIRVLGALLAIAPSIIFMGTLLSSFEDESLVFNPFVQYMVVASLTLLVGYKLMNRGVAEEEKERIKSIVREVLNEARAQTDEEAEKLRARRLSDLVERLVSENIGIGDPTGPEADSAK